MNRQRLCISYAIWIVFALAMMFLLANTYDARFITTIVFAVFAAVASVFAQLSQAGYKGKRGNLKTAPILICNAYMTIESLAGIVSCATLEHLNVKAVIAIQLSVLTISALLYLASIGGNEHVEKNEVRHKDIH